MNIDELRATRKAYFEIQEKFKKLNDEFEKEIKKQLKSIENHFLKENIKLKTLYISNGDKDNKDNWNPYIIYWFIIDNKEIYFSENIGWFYSDTYHPNIYNVNKVNINFDTSKIEACLSRILPAKPYDKEIISTVETIHSFDDIKLLLGKDIELLEEGKIWHVGWDISDYYFIIKDLENKIRIYYSTNGHGFGCDHEITPIGVKKIIEDENNNDPIEKLNEFFEYLNKKNLSDVSNRWKDLILENWTNLK